MIYRCGPMLFDLKARRDTIGEGRGKKYLFPPSCVPADREERDRQSMIHNLGIATEKKWERLYLLDV